VTPSRNIQYGLGGLSHSSSGKDFFNTSSFFEKVQELKKEGPEMTKGDRGVFYGDDFFEPSRGGKGEAFGEFKAKLSKGLGGPTSRGESL